MKKNREKMVLKNMWFFNFYFFSFFSIFCDFGSIVGGSGTSKNCKKSEKIDFFVLKGGSGSWEGFGRILEEFWEGFGKILKRFWVEFGKVLGGCWEGKF